jgi:rSAM/selenodomain-associated transferase 1
MKAECALIVMAKQPMPGRTKTRLCPPFSPQQAASFYEALLRDTLELAAGIESVQLAAAITPSSAAAYFEAITPAGTLLLPVEGADIGVCLEEALGTLFTIGYRKVFALNADGPSLPPDFLCQAVQLLDSHELVLGPGEDGGYYLVGMKHLHAGLFQDIPWSTARVLEATLAKAQLSGLYAALTPPWYDIDLPQDVERLRDELNHLPGDRLRHTRRFFKEDASA